MVHGVKNLVHKGTVLQVLFILFAYTYNRYIHLTVKFGLLLPPNSQKYTFFLISPSVCSHVSFKLSCLVVNVSSVQTPQTSEVLRAHPHKLASIFPSLWDKSFHYLGGPLWASWGGSVQIREQEAAPWYGPLYSDPTVLRLLTQPGRRRTCLCSLGRRGVRAQLRRRMEH